MTGQSGSVLAIDLGTSSVKALIAGPDGVILARGRAAYTTTHPGPDRDEQRVDDWLDAIAQAVKHARATAPTARIDAIAVTGQMHGTVLHDASGTPLQPAVIWSDRRSASTIDGLRQALGPRHPAAIGGPLGTGYMAATLDWFRRTEPEIWARIDAVALPVDAVIHALTEVLATDPSNAVSSGMLDAGTGAWDPSTLETLGVPETWLPRIVAPGEVVGRLSEDAASRLELPAGIPVSPAGGDALAAAIGGGVMHRGSALIVVSTGAQVMRPVETWAPEPEGRWHTWPTAAPSSGSDAPWMRVAAMLNGGRAIDWIHRTLCPDQPIEWVLESAGDVPAGAGGLLFLPFLAGERTPYADPYLRGSFVGLSDRHEPQHLVRAVLEGVALSVADGYRQITGDWGDPERIVLGGGGSLSTFPNILANVLGRPLTVPAAHDLSALGAANIVAIAQGWRSPDDVVAMATHDSVTVEPNARDAGVYRELFGAYVDAVSSLTPIIHRLRTIG